MLQSRTDKACVLEKQGERKSCIFSCESWRKEISRHMVACGLMLIFSKKISLATIARLHSTPPVRNSGTQRDYQPPLYFLIFLVLLSLTVTSKMHLNMWEIVGISKSTLDPLRSNQCNYWLGVVHLTCGNK